MNTTETVSENETKELTLQEQLDYIRKNWNNQLADEFMYHSELSFREFLIHNLL